MIENLEEKVKNWKEIQQRIWDIFFKFQNNYEAKHPEDLIEFSYANIEKDKLTIEYFKHLYEDDEPELCFLEIPLKYMADLSEVDMYLENKCD